MRSADTGSNGAQHWLSAHIYLDGMVHGSDGDLVLLNVVRPFVKRAFESGWTDRYFFIRYRDDGAHIRLRLRGLPHVLKEKLQPALEECAGDRIRWIPYSPEFDRYGGPLAIEVAESFFFASSRAAMLLTESIAGVQSARLAKGLLAMLVFLYVFGGTRQSVIDFSRQHSTSYLRAIAREEGQDVPWKSAFDDGYGRQSLALVSAVIDTWERLCEGESVLPALDAYRVALTETRSELERLCASGLVATGGGVVSNIDQATMWIGPSYVHMMNNRLGITIAEEAYLGHLITRAFEDPALDSAI